jgi:DnaJ-class molecular chaperone
LLQSGDESAHEVAELEKIYKVLSDADTRQVFDTFGELAVEKLQQSEIEVTAQIDEKVSVIVHELEVTLEDLYQAKIHFINFTRLLPCSTCKGIGTSDPSVKVYACRQC